MKKICFFTNNLAKVGGANKMMIFLANELIKKNYDITILSINSTSKSFFDINKKIKVHSLFNYKNPNYIEILTKFALNLYLKKNNDFDYFIDVCAVYTNISSKISHKYNIKHIIWLHENFYSAEKNNSWLKAIQNTEPNTDAFIVLTKKDQELFTRIGKYPENKIHQIYNPIIDSVNEWTDHTGIKKIVSVGRFDHVKGFDMLLEAWKLIEEKIPEWTLDIWGYTEDKPKTIHELKEKLQLKHVTLHNSTDNIGQVYKNSAVYVLPSRNEPFALVLLEALSWSLPIVAFDCPYGPAELITDGSDGYIVENGNIEALADTMLKLAQNEEDLRNFSINAYEKSKKFNKEKYVNDWIDLLEKL